MALLSPISGRSALVPFFVLLGSCALTDPDFDARGVVRFHDVAGGRWAIDTGTGAVEPLNLPEEFRVDGLHVAFEANARADIAGTPHFGPVVELEYIQMAA
jgi:hypothetical protein